MATPGSAPSCGAEGAYFPLGKLHCPVVLLSPHAQQSLNDAVNFQVASHRAKRRSSDGRCHAAARKLSLSCLGYSAARYTSRDAPPLSEEAYVQREPSLALELPVAPGEACANLSVPSARRKRTGNTFWGKKGGRSFRAPQAQLLARRRTTE